MSITFPYPYCFVFCLTSSNIAAKKKNNQKNDFLTEISAEQSYRVCSRRAKLSVRKPFTAVITLITERRHDSAGLRDNKERPWHVLGWVRLARFNKGGERKRTTRLSVRALSFPCHVGVEWKTLATKEISERRRPFSSAGSVPVYRWSIIQAEFDPVRSCYSRLHYLKLRINLNKWTVQNWGLPSPCCGTIFSKKKKYIRFKVQAEGPKERTRENGAPQHCRASTENSRKMNEWMNK